MEETGIHTEDIETGISYNYLEDVKIKNIKSSCKNLVFVVFIYILFFAISYYLCFNYTECRRGTSIILLLSIFLPLYILFIYYLLHFLSTMINYFIEEIKLKIL